MTIAEQCASSLRKLETKGAHYWDLRHEERHSEYWMQRDGIPHDGGRTESGIGMRIMYRDPATGKQGWGFSSTADLTSENIDRASEIALEAARASAILSSGNDDFDPSAAQGNWQSEVKENPFDLPAAEKRNFIQTVDEGLAASDVASRHCYLQFDHLIKTFLNSAGADLRQEFTWHGCGSSVTVKGEGRVQTRTYPNTGGNFRLGGFEGIRAYDFPGQTERMLEEAREILIAPECPSERCTVVLGPKMLGLLVHEVCGHATEFDRILGEEAAYAGTSFLTPQDIGTFRYGSPAVNMVSDPTWPQSAGSYGWDDDGSAARRQFLVERGIIAGFLTGRQNCGLINQASAAANRATNWRYQPINRITSVNFLPGDSLNRAEIIASIENGFWLDDFCGWSIDSDRGGFRFSVEDARRIHRGRLGERVRNGSFSATSTKEFFNNCFAVASDPPWVAGYSNCAKGQPVQIILVGHVVPMAAAFRDVKVGK